MKSHCRHGCMHRWHLTICVLKVNFADSRFVAACGYVEVEVVTGKN